MTYDGISPLCQQASRPEVITRRSKVVRTITTAGLITEAETEDVAEDVAEDMTGGDQQGVHLDGAVVIAERPASDTSTPQPEVAEGLDELRGHRLGDDPRAVHAIGEVLVARSAGGEVG